MNKTSVNDDLFLLTPSQFVDVVAIYILLVLFTLKFIFLCLICVTASTSETKPEEVKTLPGGKVKKKVYYQN